MFKAQKIVDNTNGLICVFTTGKVHCYDMKVHQLPNLAWHLPNSPTVFRLASLSEKRAMLKISKIM